MRIVCVRWPSTAHSAFAKHRSVVVVRFIPQTSKSTNNNNQDQTKIFRTTHANAFQVRWFLDLNQKRTPSHELNITIKLPNECRHAGQKDQNNQKHSLTSFVAKKKKKQKKITTTENIYNCNRFVLCKVWFIYFWYERKQSRELYQNL